MTEVTAEVSGDVHVLGDDLMARLVELGVPDCAVDSNSHAGTLTVSSAGHRERVTEAIRHVVAEHGAVLRRLGE